MNTCQDNFSLLPAVKGTRHVPCVASPSPRSLLPLGAAAFPSLCQSLLAAGLSRIPSHGCLLRHPLKCEKSYISGSQTGGMEGSQGSSRCPSVPLLHVQVAQALLYSVPAGGNAVALQSIKIKQQKHPSYKCHFTSYKENATEFLSFPHIR